MEPTARGPASLAGAPAFLSSPPLSLAERDRRWNAVRQLMEQERVDAIFVAGMGASTADARYLTNLASQPQAPVWVVFPLRGPPIAISRCNPSAANVVPWVADIVPPAASYTGATVDLVRSLHLRHGRLGMVGMEGGRTPAQPSAPNVLAQALVDAAPGVAFVDLSQPLRDLRAYKSAEEVDLLRQSAQTLDAAFDHMDRVARPGMRALDLWAAGVGAVCSVGGEMPVSARWASAARPRALARPVHGVLVQGFVVATELEASRHGYAARAVHPMVIEHCGPTVVELYRALGELWERTVEQIRPGVALGAVQRLVRAYAAPLAKPRGPFRNAAAWLVLGGAGLGYDAPHFDGRSLVTDAEAQVFQEGWAFSLAVWLRADGDGRQYLAGWGDPVVVGAAGCSRLGSRVPGRVQGPIPRP
jgi:Xaa-Pro aminopeptidase